MFWVLYTCTIKDAPWLFKVVYIIKVPISINKSCIRNILKWNFGNALIIGEKNLLKICYGFSVAKACTYQLSHVTYLKKSHLFLVHTSI